MVRMLLLELDNSWIMVSVSSLGNHVPPVVMRVTQQLEHGIFSIRNYSSPVIMRVGKQLEHVLSSVDNHAPPVVMRV